MSWHDYPPYVPVAERKKKAQREIARRKKAGESIEPVAITGRTIAGTFWGKAWCAHLESYSDYANRLPRGRTYVRNGSVLHLAIAAGRVDALVQGTELYKIAITIAPLAKPKWQLVVDACSGKIDSLVELLQGKLSKGVMEVVTDRAEGLFPKPAQIALKCSCPDHATMCKHVAAVLYGVGARLDVRPELLFRLRNVDHLDLIGHATEAAPARARKARGKALAESDLSSMFGIEIDEGAAKPDGTSAAPLPRGQHVDAAPKGARAVSPSKKRAVRPSSR